MNELIEKLKVVLKELLEEEGEIVFFALFLREDSNNKWDLIVSADSLSSDDVDSYRIIAAKIQNTLLENELIKISRIVIIDKNDPMILSLRSSLKITGDGYLNLSDCEFFSKNVKFSVKNAYVFRCI